MSDNESADDRNAPESTDNVLRLLEMEYKSSVRRHDDIYKSMWTNFSYMAILAAGILTFGKDKLPLELIGLLACLPLVFWFWSSFLPLDRYGNQVAKRIAEIEKFLSAMYFHSVQDLDIVDNTATENKARGGLFLYTDFESRKKANEGMIRWLSEKIRVRKPVGVFAIVIHVLLIIMAFNWCRHSFPFDTPEKPDVQILSSVESMKNSLSSISNSAEQISNSTRKATLSNSDPHGSTNTAESTPTPKNEEDGK
jgi:hypothetical protein